METLDLGTNSIGVSEQILIAEKKLVVARKQNVAPYLKMNQDLSNHGRNMKAQSAIAANIPVVLYYHWKKEWKDKASKVFTWQTFLKMKLNERDHRYLRTDGGKRL